MNLLRFHNHSERILCLLSFGSLFSGCPSLLPFATHFLAPPFAAVCFTEVAGPGTTPASAVTFFVSPNRQALSASFYLHAHSARIAVLLHRVAFCATTIRYAFPRPFPGSDSNGWVPVTTIPCAYAGLLSPPCAARRLPSPGTAPARAVISLSAPLGTHFPPPVLRDRLPDPAPCAWQRSRPPGPRSCFQAPGQMPIEPATHRHHQSTNEARILHARR
jgi:hypothetical protein